MSKLMLSSGKVFKSYALLERYLELCPEEERASSLPTSSDIEFVKHVLSRGTGTLHDVLEELANRFLSRVSPACSSAAARSVLGAEMPEEQSARLIAVQLAGWTLEIAEALGVVKLRSLYAV